MFEGAKKEGGVVVSEISMVPLFLSWIFRKIGLLWK